MRFGNLGVGAVPSRLHRLQYWGTPVPRVSMARVLPRHCLTHAGRSALQGSAWCQILLARGQLGTNCCFHQDLLEPEVSLLFVLGLPKPFTDFAPLCLMRLPQTPKPRVTGVARWHELVAGSAGLIPLGPRHAPKPKRGRKGLGWG